MATFYCNTTGSSPAYSVSFSYGDVTRSGNTVTIKDIKVTMQSISVSGNNWQTTNRLAYRCGIGGSQTNIESNKTLHDSGSLASTSYTINIGTKTVTVGATDTSFSFYFALASTGWSVNWDDNFQGNSPCVIFNGSISCPAGQPTWTTQPTASAVNETQINVSLGATDMSSTKTIFYKKSSDSSYTSTTSTTLSGLSANTTYNIYVQASANTFNVNSNTLTVTTYKYPSLSSISPTSGNIGSSVKLNFSNPLSRTLTIKMQYCLTSGGTYTDYKDGGSSTKTWTSSGTSTTITPTASALYNLIPKQTSIYVKFIVTYGSIAAGTSSVFTYNMVAADCAPSWTGVSASDITYYDGNETITKITGNNQQIVQSESNIYIKLGKAATAQYGATINSYTCMITGNTASQTLVVNTAKSMGTSTSGSTITVTIVAKDSRGQTTAITKNITNIIPYSPPSGVMTLKRVNNWENQTTLTIVPNWAINNNNAGIISYKYKKSTDSSWSNVYQYSSQVTLNLDNQYSWDFLVAISDKVGGTRNLTGTVDRGAPICFMDPTKLSVGINKFPSINNGLDVNGPIKGNGADGVNRNVNTLLNYGAQKFVVGGDADTYYPVLFTPSGVTGFPYVVYTISRAYYAPGPDTWNTNTHRGGLTYSFMWTGDSSWGGNDKKIMCIEFNETYTTMVTKTLLTTDGYVVWLRGGNAEYYLHSGVGSAITISPKMSEFTCKDNVKIAPMAYDADQAKIITMSALTQRYPVGAIYISTDPTSPASLFGGSWTHINSKFLYSTESETAATTGTGGSSTRTLLATNIPKHSHHIPALTGTAESAGDHTHGYASQKKRWADSAMSEAGSVLASADARDHYEVWYTTSSAGAHTHTVTTNSSTTGTYGGRSTSNTPSPISILPPYYLVHIWRRTA